MFGFSFIINSQYCLPELGLVCAEPEKQIKAGDNTLSFSGRVRDNKGER